MMIVNNINDSNNNSSNDSNNDNNNDNSNDSNNNNNNDNNNPTLACTFRAHHVTAMRHAVRRANRQTSYFTIPATILGY